MPASRPNLITINEAAGICGWHHKTVRRYIREGKLPAYRVGEYHVRLDRRDVEALIRPLATAASGRAS